MSSKLEMYKRLGEQVPVINREAYDQIQAGNMITLQSALGQAAPASPRATVAQSLAPQVAGQSVASAVTSAQNTNQQLGQAASVELGAKAEQAGQDLQARQVNQGEQAAAAKNKLTLNLNKAGLESQARVASAENQSKQRLALTGTEVDNRMLKLSLKQTEELSAVGRNIKSEIFDSRIKFEKDEAGRRFSNERQLADYIALNSKTEIEFGIKMREMQQLSDIKTELLEASYKQISATLERGWLTEEQRLDFEQAKYLAEMKNKIEKEIAKNKAKSNNNRAIAVGVGTVVGAVVGGVLGAAAGGVGAAPGAMIGASVGAGAGGVIHGAGANAGVWD